MDTQRWQRISTIFDAVIEAQPAMRGQLLDQLCASDVDIRREVDALLAADGSAAQFDAKVDSARNSIAVDWVDADERDSVRSDERFGPWRVLRELGRGGMGVVWLAQRADGQFEQRAALKLIKRGMDSEALIARFLRERQILARLEHPHIARLLDGGIAADGRPYFAMEYVDGQPLLHYCAEHGLKLEARIELFLQICAAVQFAHGQLVVHRDIKPSNILITASGDAKLLDFGIAKLLATEFGNEATATAVGQDRPLTLAYAAPEQLRGEPVTIATDVYALGCVLYELLTGSRPYPFADTSTPAQALQTLDSARPDAPSKRASANAPVATRRLRGDLDTIVLKALQPEPARRYATVDALAEDLRRHLAGLPITARRDHTLYRTGKFVRRHWLGVSATAIVAIALLASTAISLRAARIAREQATRAQTVTHFLTDLFRFADPKGTTGSVRMTAAQMLDAGAQSFDQELHGEPTLAAEFAATLGSIYIQLGEYDRAIGLLRRALAGSILDPVEHASVDADLARALYEKGDYVEAQRNVDNAQKLHIALFGARSAAVAADIAQSGEIARREGDFKRAEVLTQQALALSRETLTAPNAQIAAELNQLATLYDDMRRVQDARAPTQQAIAMFRALYGENHLDVAENLANLGVIDMQTDRVDEALPLFEQAEAIYRKLLPGDHPLLATVLANQARVLDRLGRYDASQKKYMQALAMQRKLLGDSHPDVAATLNNLSVLHAEQGDYQSSADLSRQVLAIWQKLGKPDHPLALITRVHLATALRETGDTAQSEGLLREASASAKKRLGNAHPIALLADSELAITLRDENKLDAALALQRTTQAALESTKGLPPQLIAGATAQLALTELAHGDLADARAHVDAAMKIFDSMKTVDAVALSGVLKAQARVYLAQGQTAAGCAAADRALTSMQLKFGEDSFRVAQAHVVHGECLAKQGKFADARTELTHAALRLEALAGPQNPSARDARIALEMPSLAR